MRYSWTIDDTIGMEEFDDRYVRPNVILMVNLGRTHDDRDAIARQLRAKGFNVRYLNLLEDSIKDVPFGNVAAVDLKGCRGWQQHASHFRRQMEYLRQAIRISRRSVSVCNDPTMFEWAESKEYLEEFERKQIPIVPTVFVRSNDTIPDIKGLIAANAFQKIVIKPAVGSRASHLLFIVGRADGDYDIITPRPRCDAAAPVIITISPEEVQSVVDDYYDRVLTQRRQSAFLIQGYCEGVETSAVFIESSPHFVIRTKANDNMVAHEDFGGHNIIDPIPHPDLVTLAHRVRENLPAHLANPPYLRVDMLHDGVNAPLLMEVEAGSARLFLNEAGRVDDYADALEMRISQAASSRAIMIVDELSCLEAFPENSG